MKKSFFFVILFVVLHAFPASFFAQGVPGWFLPYDAIFMDMNYASEAIAVGDINGDGLDDVAVTAYIHASSEINKLFVFIQNTVTHTLNPPISYNITVPYFNSCPSQVLVCDVSGDGFNDVVTCAENGFAVYTHKGSDPLDPLAPAHFYLTTRNNDSTYFTPNNIQFGDFNHDDLNDIVVRNTEDEEILVFCQNSSHTLDSVERFPANGNMSIYCNLSVADFDGDGLKDIFYLDDSTYPYNFVVLTQAASGGFNAPYKKSYAFPEPWETWIQSMEVGDVTGDNLPDIVISQGGNKPNSYVSVLANLGGSLSDPQTYPSYDCPNAIDIADITGDGRKDIVVQHHGWNRLGLYLQKSDGALAIEELYKYDENTFSINSLACGDINGDGHLDAIQCPAIYGGPGGLHVLFGTSGSVIPTINVLCPNGGEKWKMNSSQRIEWNTTSDVEYVKIGFSADNGGSWITLAEKEQSSANYSSNAFSWDLSITQPSNQCRIRITKVLTDGTAVPSISDTSLWPFKVYDESSASITITSPNGGENWQSGDSREISWTSTNFLDNVNIYYSTTNGSFWETIASNTDNDGSYIWTVPDTPSTICLVRVEGDSGSPGDVSDAVFTIAPPDPTLVVTAPSISSQWEKGRTHAITWLKQGAQNANVKIALFKDVNTLVQMIANATANDGSFDWSIPANLAVGKNYFIRVRTLDNLISDFSDKFSIIVPKISLTAPAAGAVWVRGTTRAITWSKVGAQDAGVRILLYKDGIKKLDIALSAPNSGVFDWAIPSALSRGLYTVRVRTLDGKVTGTSKAFTIARN